MDDGGVQADPAVSLEVLAEVTASLAIGAPRAEVLARAGLDDARWEAARDAWLERMAARAGGGDLRMSKRFADLVARCEQRAHAEREGKPRPLPGAIPTPPAPKLVRIPRGAPPPELAAPGPMLVAPRSLAAAPTAAAPPSVVASRPIAAPPPVAPPPRVAAPEPAPPPRVAAPEPAPPPPRAPRKIWKTATLDANDAVRAALPFLPSGGAPAPKTTDAHGHLPFRAAPPPAGAAHGNPPFRAPPAPPAVVTGHAHLPFRAAGPGMAGAPAGGAPAAAASVDGAWKALEDYARLCARVRAAPARVPELMAEHGFDVSGWQNMHAEWARRFEKNPQLRKHWQQLIDAHFARDAGA